MLRNLERLVLGWDLFGGDSNGIWHQNAFDLKFQKNVLQPKKGMIQLLIIGERRLHNTKHDLKSPIDNFVSVRFGRILDGFPLISLRCYSSCSLFPDSRCFESQVCRVPTLFIGKIVPESRRVRQPIANLR